MLLTFSTEPQGAGPGAEPSPREKLANQLASVLEMQRRKQKVLHPWALVHSTYVDH